MKKCNCEINQICVLCADIYDIKINQTNLPTFTAEAEKEAKFRYEESEDELNCLYTAKQIEEIKITTFKNATNWAFDQLHGKTKNKIMARHPKIEIEPQSYTLTNQLRWGWVNKPVFIGHLRELMQETKVLQQMWQGSKGHCKWEEVPNITE